MIDLLSLDSLMACLLVGLRCGSPTILVLLPLLCGLCDGLASAAHPLLGAALLSQLRTPFTLAWCAAWPVALLARPASHPATSRGGAAILLLLPVLLCLDNLADGGEGGPLAEAIGSLACGLAGIVLARLWRNHAHQRLQALRR